MKNPRLFTQQDLEVLFPGHTLTLKRVGRVGAWYDSLDRNGLRTLLKVLHPELSEDVSSQLEFDNEIAALEKVQHKGFLKVTRVGQTGGARYVFLQHFDGVPLSEAFPDLVLPYTDAAYLMAHVCAALASMHAQGMTHFGVKPSNIWFNADGGVKLFQLGQVRFSDRLVDYPTVMVSGGFVPPEVKKSGLGICPLADIFAVGASLSELIVGMTPDLYARQPSELVACRPEIDEVISRCCQPDPLKRAKSVYGIGKILTLIAEGQPVPDYLW